MSAPVPVFVTADIVGLYERSDDRWDVLLVQRKNEPFKGQWCLPGGHVDPDETVEEAAVREFAEETGVTVSTADLLPMFTASTPGRDPRGRYISIVYSTGLLLEDLARVKGGDDAVEAKLFPIEEVLQMDLGFDHKEILFRVINARSFYDQS